MIFNGHTQDSIAKIDEVTMSEVMVMYSDGVIGNRGVLQTLGSLTAGVFNYLRSPSSTAYDLKSVLGSAYGYMFAEKESNPSESLLTFMSQAQGFDSSKFKKD